MNAFAKVLSSVLVVLYYLLEGIILTFVPKRLRYKDVSGDTVLVTGGGSGIGRLLSLRFGKLGSRVVVWDLHLPSAQETVQMILDQGGAAFAYQCDVSKPQNVYEAAARVKKEVGKVTILINNAGIVTGKKFLDCPDSMIQKTFEVNSVSHFWTVKAFLRDMMDANHGHIVSIASMAGINGVAKLTDYCASKFAAVGFEEALRMELYLDGYSGIHSTVVCPYFISTGMFDGVHPGILTILTPDYVADEIVSAILVNQEVLYLPKIFYFLVFLKSFIPSRALREALCMLSIVTSMKRFHGRDDSPCAKPVDTSPSSKDTNQVPCPAVNGTGPPKPLTNGVNGHFAPPRSTDSDDEHDSNTTTRVPSARSLTDEYGKEESGHLETTEGHRPSEKLSNGHVFQKPTTNGIDSCYERKAAADSKFVNFGKLKPMTNGMDLRCQNQPVINGICPPSPICSGKVKMG